MDDTPTSPAADKRGVGSDRLAGAALVLLALGIAWETRSLPLGSLSHPGPGYLPLALAVLLALLGAIVAMRGGPELRSLDWTEARHAVMILAGCAFAALALEVIGYRLTVIALLVFFLGIVERRPPAAVAIAALALSLGSFYLFSDLLLVPLPRGPWNF